MPGVTISIYKAIWLKWTTAHLTANLEHLLACKAHKGRKDRKDRNGRKEHKARKVCKVRKACKARKG